jgi:hypothetical protein
VGSGFGDRIAMRVELRLRRLGCGDKASSSCSDIPLGAFRQSWARHQIQVLIWVFISRSSARFAILGFRGISQVARCWRGWENCLVAGKLRLVIVIDGFMMVG